MVALCVATVGTMEGSVCAAPTGAGPQMVAAAQNLLQEGRRALAAEAAAALQKLELAYLNAASGGV